MERRPFQFFGPTGDEYLSRWTLLVGHMAGITHKAAA
jgi:hypothetical protein